MGCCEANLVGTALPDCRDDSDRTVRRAQSRVTRVRAFSKKKSEPPTIGFFFVACVCAVCDAADSSSYYFYSSRSSGCTADAAEAVASGKRPGGFLARTASAASLSDALFQSDSRSVATATKQSIHHNDGLSRRTCRHNEKACSIVAHRRRQRPSRCRPHDSTKDSASVLVAMEKIMKDHIRSFQTESLFFFGKQPLWCKPPDVPQLAPTDQTANVIQSLPSTHLDTNRNSIYVLAVKVQRRVRLMSQG